MNKYFITTFLFLLLLIKIALTQKHNQTELFQSQTESNSNLDNPNITAAITNIEKEVSTNLSPNNKIHLETEFETEFNTKMASVLSKEEIEEEEIEKEDEITDKPYLELKFKPKFMEVYYRNMMDSCNRKLFKYNIIDSIKLLLNSVIAESNKNISNKLILSTIEKFIRYKDGTIIKYNIYAFLLNLQKDSSRKYKFELEIENEKVIVKNIKGYNVDKPIKRFTCTESIDCSERHSSLKQKFKNNFIPNIDDTELEYDLFKNPLDNSKNAVLNRNNTILVPNMKTKTTFPCRKNKFSWDTHGIEYVDPSKNDCYGINSAVRQRNIKPYYHTSLFNNYNFENKTDINNVFDWKNLLYRDKTVG